MQVEGYESVVLQYQKKKTNSLEAGGHFGILTKFGTKVPKTQPTHSFNPPLTQKIPKISQKPLKFFKMVKI